MFRRLFRILCILFYHIYSCFSQNKMVLKIWNFKGLRERGKRSVTEMLPHFKTTWSCQTMRFKKFLFLPKTFSLFCFCFPLSQFLFSFPASSALIFQVSFTKNLCAHMYVFIPHKLTHGDNISMHKCKKKLCIVNDN